MSWYDTHKEEHKFTVKAWREAHPEHAQYELNWRREDRKKNPDKYWPYDFDKKWLPFGIDHHWYLIQFEKQNGVCAICGEPEREFDKKQQRRRRLAVDHNHLTHEIRGLLCSRCNKLLFIIELIPDWFTKAWNYLKQFKTLQD